MPKLTVFVFKFGFTAFPTMLDFDNGYRLSLERIFFYLEPSNTHDPWSLITNA